MLIARRIPFLTFRLFHLSGGIVHQVYNHLYPSTETELALAVRDKRALGYHDVRIGNAPDARLVKFIGKDLPRLIPTARERFELWRKLHGQYGPGELGYSEWVRQILVGVGLWTEAESEQFDDSDSEGGDW